MTTRKTEITLDGAALRFLEERAQADRRLRDEPLPPLPSQVNRTPELAGKLRSEKARRLVVGTGNRARQAGLQAEADNARELQALRRKRDVAKAELATLQAGGKVQGDG